MLRILGMVIGLFCTATVFTAVLLLVSIWGQGNLNKENTEEIVAILKGEPRPSDLKQVEEEPDMTSNEQIIKMRTERILSISSRESELAILIQAIDEQANQVLAERKQLQLLKKTFWEELEKEKAEIASAAVTQARGILLKMEPESAVEKLLSLETADAVKLLKGMPEKDSARILDQFRLRIAGKDPSQRVEKAEEIYKAIYRGDPLIQSVQQAQQALGDREGGEAEAR